MDPIELLMNEHRLIEQVLAALESYAACLSQGGEPSRADLAAATDFLRGFADSLHHSKEEDRLFEAMVEHGFAREAGPIGVMLHDHAQSRGLVRVMTEVSKLSGPWTDGQREAVVEAASGYAQLLRAHIQKEDRILYPMAREHLPAEVMTALGDSFAEITAQRAADAERYETLARDLVARLVPAAAPAPAPAPRVATRCSVCDG